MCRKIRRFTFGQVCIYYDTPIHLCNLYEWNCSLLFTTSHVGPTRGHKRSLQ